MKQKLNSMKSILKVRFVVCAFVALSSMSVYAQSIRVLDKEGRGIPYVVVTDKNGSLLGSTDMVGTLSDIRGNNELTVAHMAYKTQQVSYNSLQDGYITMEDADYPLPTQDAWTKSELLIEAFYRFYVYDEGRLKGFMTGIMPIFIESPQSVITGNYWENSVEFGSTSVVALKTFPFLFSTLTMTFPMMIVNDGAIQNALAIKVKEEGKSTQSLSIGKRMIGHTARTGDKICLSTDMMTIIKALFKQMADTKEREVFSMAMSGNATWQQTAVIGMDDDDMMGINNMKMFSSVFSGNVKGQNETIVFETYVTSRKFTNKKEFKAKKKMLKEQYGKSMTFTQTEAYAAEHHIPSLASNLNRAIIKLTFK